MTVPANAPTIIPPPDSELEVLALDARRRRARIEATLGAMSARLERAQANMEDYGERIEAFDEKVRRHRWPLVAASLLVGGLLGRRPRPKQVLLLPATTNSSSHATGERGSALRAAVGAFATYFARRALERWLAPKGGESW